MQIDIGKLEEWLQANKEDPLARRFRGFQLQEKEQEIVLGMLNRVQVDIERTATFIEKLYSDGCQHEMGGNPFDATINCRFCDYGAEVTWAPVLTKWAERVKAEKLEAVSDPLIHLVKTMKEKLAHEILNKQKGENHEKDHRRKTPGSPDIAAEGQRAGAGAGECLPVGLEPSLQQRAGGSESCSELAQSVGVEASCSSSGGTYSSGGTD
jgi:hypothetical protein